MSVPNLSGPFWGMGDCNGEYWSRGFPFGACAATASLASIPAMCPSATASTVIAPIPCLSYVQATSFPLAATIGSGCGGGGNHHGHGHGHGRGFGVRHWTN